MSPLAAEHGDDRRPGRPAPTLRPSPIQRAGVGSSATVRRPDPRAAPRRRAVGAVDGLDEVGQGLVAEASRRRWPARPRRPGFSPGRS
ncbi:MAG: hypothetical protein MZW92_10125 [Comamonadaceae bacterium]|nr:hypothetical protein [Comamonadaceae bacterium]